MAGVGRKSSSEMSPHIPACVWMIWVQTEFAPPNYPVLTVRRAEIECAHGAARRGGTFHLNCADCCCAAFDGLSRDIASDADLCACPPRLRAGRGRLARRDQWRALSRFHLRRRRQRARPCASASGRGAAEQAQKLWHVSNLYEIPEAERAAERLCAASFADVVFFCNSGAEAMEGAIKMRAQISVGERRAGALPHHHLRRRLPWPHAGDARRRRAEEISRRFRPGGRRLRSGSVRRSRGRQARDRRARPRRS